MVPLGRLRYSSDCLLLTGKRGETVPVRSCVQFNHKFASALWLSQAVFACIWCAGYVWVKDFVFLHKMWCSVRFQWQKQILVQY